MKAEVKEASPPLFAATPCHTVVPKRTILRIQAGNQEVRSEAKDAEYLHAAKNVRSRAKEEVEVGNDLGKKRRRKAVKAEVKEENRNAYVTCIFGKHPAYCLDAVVFGRSLRRMTNHEMVCLYCDIKGDWLPALQAAGWITKEVEHVKYSQRLYKSGGRFSHVFTKLRAVALSEYDRVLLVDADLIARQSPDELFLRDPPCAVRRHPTGKYQDNAEIDGTQFFDEKL